MKFTAIPLLLVLALGSACGSTSSGGSGGSGNKPAAADCGDGSMPVISVQCAVDKTDAEKPAVSRAGPGNYVVTFSVSDNLTRGMTRGGLALNVFDMAKQIKSLQGLQLNRVQFQAKTKVVDAYGAESTDVVFRAMFLGSTIRRIQYDNINTASWGTLEQLADAPVYLLPDMAK
jgi:hypothetical protein